jgi:O-antigen/teichoic acid export membrane protein
LLFLDFFKLFIGKDYREGLTVVPILLMANVLLGIYYNISVWFRLKDRTTTGAVVSLAGAFLTIVLNFWWIPLFGYVGASWVTLICYAFMCWATWLTGRKHYPVPYPFGRMALYIGVALAFYGLAQVLTALIPPDFSELKWLVRAILWISYMMLVWKKEKLRSSATAV